MNDKVETVLMTVIGVVTVALVTMGARLVDQSQAERQALRDANTQLRIENTQLQTHLDVLLDAHQVIVRM